MHLDRAQFRVSEFILVVQETQLFPSSLLIIFYATFFSCLTTHVTLDRYFMLMRAEQLGEESVLIMIMH